jgi:hypothetical protein
MLLLKLPLLEELFGKEFDAVKVLRLLNNKEIDAKKQAALLKKPRN